MNRGSIPNPSAGTKWPLTGGVPSQLSISKNNGIERVYLAGYSDGSVRIWNATYPLLSFICLVQGEVRVHHFSLINFCLYKGDTKLSHVTGRCKV